LLAHSLTDEALRSAVKSGLLAEEGFAGACFCENRIAFDRGWVVIFQGKDLVEAGYPLIRIDETPKDAALLNEWRSLAVDINLARLIIPTSSIPDYNRASKNKYYADSIFGEEFLASLPRL